MSTPFGDFTPFGYLRNPYHRARSWNACEGGNLRTSDETLGFEWTYPWHKQPRAGVGVSIICVSGERRLVTRRDYQQVAYACDYHSANMMAFRWRLHDVLYGARFFLHQDTLCCTVVAENVAVAARSARIDLLLRAWSADAAPAVIQPQTGPPGTHPLVVQPGGADPAHALAASTERGTATRWGDMRRMSPAGPGGLLYPGEAWWHATVSDETLEPGSTATWYAALGRGTTAADACSRATTVLTARAGDDKYPSTTPLSEALERVRREDTRFFDSAPRLIGDWPAHWQEGLHYDLQTTRALVMEPGGIFNDVWPTWMAAWPRVVVAEGVLDMQRLGYADPDLAKRAVLSLFRDAPAPHVPCVFEGGEPNMVAADGSICGTSPAWCLPFLQLERLYLRTVDKEWLSQLYPHLAAYLAWWLEHRLDREGWVVYQCTWEAGEDGNPRLDPAGTGAGVIREHVRPVELQAAVAHGAEVLAFFARELGQPADARRWRKVQRAYARRTQALWDPTEGRFRDWLTREGRFQDPNPGELYWGTDSRRFGALSLVPLALGLATPEQVDALHEEVRRHATGPWTWWPSWCLVLLEAAQAAGLHDVVGAVCDEILDRVYRFNARRSLDGQRFPTPGSAREYWPPDMAAYDASDQYGWGATTADFLLRHLLGIHEHRDTRRWTLTLQPNPWAFSSPERWTHAVARGVANVRYRDLVLGLRVERHAGGDGLAVTVEFQTLVDVWARVGNRPISRRRGQTFEFLLERSEALTISTDLKAFRRTHGV